MKIELYLNSEKGYVKKGNPYYETVSSKSIGTWHGPPEHYWIPKKSFIGFSKEERELINLVARIAEQYHLKQRVYDVAKTRCRYRAFFKGVVVTPTVVIGKKMLTRNITEERLIEALGERQKKK